MNDRLKFRCWDDIHREMIDLQEQDVNPYNISDIPQNNLMQCTGLRDKRHQLIYESDIVTDGYNNMLVYYNRETCSFAMQKRTKYTLKRFGKNGYEVVSLRNLSENHFKNYQLEIIGNEFQNPELLEVNNEHT